MRFFPRGYFTRIFLGAALTPAGLLAWNEYTLTDAFFWPETGKQRIQWMASFLRENRRLARWCAPSENPENIYTFSGNEPKEEIGACLSSIRPVGGFSGELRGSQSPAYLKRLYRGEVGDKFCEVTLSTFEDDENLDDRIVGFDCYFGLFPKAKDKGIGMTDDKFG